MQACSTDNEIERKYLFSSEIESNRNTNKNGAFNDYFTATEYSFIPDLDRLKMVNRYDKLSRPALNYTQLFQHYQQVDAVNYISGQLKYSEILILNESHNHPVHRNFATQLLSALYANGFRYLGVETLTNRGDFEQPAYPTLNLGHYSVEPTFGRFLRAAIKMGFTLFPYDDPTVNGADREIRQAENITEFIETHTAGKTFIYCGLDHVNEGKHPTWGKVMAGQLHERSGINPLTINQTYFNDIKPVSWNSPVVLKDSTGIYQPYDQCDIYVFHPIYSTEANRINWKKDNQNEWLKVDFVPDNITFPALVKVYLSHEDGADRIPYDIIELLDKNDEEWLVVPKTGPYTIYIEEMYKAEYKFSE